MSEFKRNMYLITADSMSKSKSIADNKSVDNFTNTFRVPRNVPNLIPFSESGFINFLKQSNNKISELLVNSFVKPNQTPIKS